MPVRRDERLPDQPQHPDDLRTPFEKDRDRIIYSSAHRRLVDVTQVVSSDHGSAFHNRLTHCQKVEQIGQRLAQRLLKKHSAGLPGLGDNLDPEVVQAACLAHDLGHPPFGHIGEETLNDLVLADNEPDGFEGNAQSFRVVTKLAVIRTGTLGLNLTSATLAAMLKYPWPRDCSEGANVHQKYGYYRLEQDQFNHASSHLQRDGDKFVKSIEAEVMDLADDITYCVHDLEDFHRAGFIPWHSILGPKSSDFMLRLISRSMRSRSAQAAGSLENMQAAYSNLFQKDRGFFCQDFYSPVVHQPYDGSFNQRIALRRLIADLIDRFVSSASIGFRKNRWILDLPSERRNELRIMKEITSNFIHESVSLGAQQHGQKIIIETLYKGFSFDIKRHVEGGLDKQGQCNEPFKLLPRRFHHMVRLDGGRPGLPDGLPRLVADCIASLGEQEARGLANRIAGWHGGSAKDQIVY